MEERDSLAIEMFGLPYSKLTEEEKKEIEEMIKMRNISKLKSEA